MSKPIKEDMLIFVDSGNNNNKFYHMVLHENGQIDIEYGRVGNNPQKTKKTGGERTYNTTLNAKLKKGYERSEIALENKTENTSKSPDLLKLAMSQIKHSDSKVKDLIKRLVEKNIHNITTATKISFNKDSGMFMTPLGPVTIAGINKAKEALSKIAAIVVNNNENADVILTKRRFITYNETYFKIIPTKIANLRIAKNYMLISQDRINEQFAICDTLIQTMELMKTEAKTKKPKAKDEPEEEVFEVKMSLVEDPKTIKRINEKFNDSKNSMHGHSTNSLTIENIYEVSLGKEEKQFRNDLDNVWELWHGTRVVNLLSILKSGLLMPRSTPGQTTGAMFSDGLYFSDQSTKSLGYCDGMLWNSSSKQSRVYMFLADVAMGDYEVPSGPTSRKPSQGKDSYFAKANLSGVRNNEMIVFDTNQIKLRYILEIK